MLGMWEIITICIVGIIAILWLGKKAPDMARTAGESIKQFKEGMNETKQEIKKIGTA